MTARRIGKTGWIVAGVASLLLASCLGLAASFLFPALGMCGHHENTAAALEACRSQEHLLAVTLAGAAVALLFGAFAFRKAFRSLARG